MFATAFRPAVSNTARRAVVNDQSRRLSQLTMGFDEIAAWKAGQSEKARFKLWPDAKRTIFDLKLYTLITQGKQTHSHPAAKPTIFDIKIRAPINKSNTWNISFAPEVEVESPPLPQFTLLGVSSRHFPPRRITTAQADVSPIRFPSAYTYSSLAVNMRPVALPEPVFGVERRASQITDIPCIEILRKLYVEQVDEQPPAEKETEQTTEENPEEPSGKPANWPTECPVWYP